VIRPVIAAFLDLTLGLFACLAIQFEEFKCRELSSRVVTLVTTLPIFIFFIDLICA